LGQAEKIGGPILELACGTGRITIELAAAGYDVTGLDIMPPMLSLAQKKAKDRNVKIEWIHADCRNFKLAQKFKLIIFPFNSIAHLHELKDIETCFSCVKNHLTDDGRFIIDFFNPSLKILLRDSSKRYPVVEYPDPDGKGMVVITENNVYDAASQINRIKWYFKIGDRPDEMIQQLNMRIFYPRELDTLLHYSGFTIENKYGDYDLSPFESTSPKQLIVCRKIESSNGEA
jgi:SAM-dependent methyltransferase